MQGRVPGGDRHRHADQGSAPPRARRARRAGGAASSRDTTPAPSAPPALAAARSARPASAPACAAVVDAAAGAGAAARAPQREGAGARVYLPVVPEPDLRRPGGDAGGPTLPEALVAVSARAGRPLWIPPDVAGHCCGTPWSSKGYARRPRADMAARTAAALRRWSDDGELPVVMDASSCTPRPASRTSTSTASRCIDAVAWVHDHLLERLEITHRLGSVVVHPTCAAAHLGVSRQAGGDRRRGWPTRSWSPPPPAAAAWPATAAGCTPSCRPRRWRDVAAELAAGRFDACVSSNRTCEIALRQVTGRPYESFVLTLEALTRSADDRPTRRAMASGASVTRPAPPPAGLCDSCRHQQIVRNTRGSVFSLCRRSKTSPIASPATRGSRSGSGCPGYERRALLRRKRIEDDQVASRPEPAGAARRTGRGR